MARLNPTRTPSGFTTFLGGIFLLALFAGIIVWWITANRPKDEIEAKRAAARVATREQLATQHGERLHGTGWADKAQGVAYIPIQDAKKLVLAELKSKQAKASSVKVEPPLPIVAPDPNSTEPPPPALPAAPQGADTISFAVRVPESPPGGQGSQTNQPPVPSSTAPTQQATPTAAPSNLPAAPVPQAPAAPAPTVPNPAPSATPATTPGLPPTPTTTEPNPAAPASASATPANDEAAPALSAAPTPSAPPAAAAP